MTPSAVEIHEPGSPLRLSSSRNPAPARLAYLRPLVKGPLSSFVPNIGSRMGAVVLGGKLAPFVVNDRKEPCYLVDISSKIGGNLARHIGLSGKPGWRSAVARGLAPLLEATRFDRVVFLNHWLLSTNPTLRWSAAEIDSAMAALARRYPSHALVLKSAPPAPSPAGTPLATFTYKRNYCVPAASRKTRNIAADLALLRDTPLRVEEPHALSDTEAARLAALYDQLYLGKYSERSPRLSPAWLRLAVESALFRCVVVRDKDQILGFSLQMIDGEQLISSYIGYDTSAPREAGVYRLLMLSGWLEARRLGLVFNMSGGGGEEGVSTFKRQRGAVLVPQPGAVYCAHLGWPRSRLYPPVFQSYYNT
ncbi:MAG: GNAT family N-acetyltransferase [Polyangiaceae bacterium]